MATQHALAQRHSVADADGRGLQHRQRRRRRHPRVMREVRQAADLLRRPVLAHRAPEDVLHGQRAPDVGVVRVVAVVAHDKHLAGRHGQLLEHVRGLLVDERLHLGNAVDVQLPLAHLHGVARHRHDALDEHVIVKERRAAHAARGVEDDDVAGGGRPDEAVRYLLRDQAVAHVKAGVHGQRGDEARLRDEEADAVADGDGCGDGDEVIL
mmetsp:Transcript_32831/g.83326  ORF Transcript_32831/g.83326 Transcript_32831/m.83326 type:complete len:210 (-) Transcript_32831:395-1024(-)